MNRKLLLFQFFYLFIFSSSIASHLAGGEITYKYLGNEKYEVTFKFYRDCRGGSLISPSFKLLDVNTTTEINLNAKLVSIRDISNVCDTFSKKCNPSNKQISTTVPIFEEHIYSYQIDFNGNESSFKKVCLLKIGMGQCCRPSNITTGGAGNDFWVSSSLNLCTAPKNSSPIFLTPPILSLCCNQPAYLSNTAADTLDRDSLSYSLSEPMQNWFSKVDWSSTRNYKSPFEDYWPAGYDKNKGPNPNTNPPIGTYFGPDGEGPIFIPTNCSEVTKMAVKVTEWRKDSTGKYKVIGDITRDLIISNVTCPDNNPPLLYGPYKFDVCAGNQICFTISSDDKQFIPAPPKKPNPPDSVKLSWTGGNMKGATYTIVNPNERLQKVKFCWTPKESDVSDISYSFSITAKDNSCPMNSVTTKTYLVKVKPSAKTKVTIKHSATNKKVLESQIIQPFKGTPQFFWQIMDSMQQPLTTDYYFFKQTKTITSYRNNDSVIFRKAGKYLVYHRINNAPNNCPGIYFDTLTIPKVIDVTFFKTKDTSVCKGAVLNFKAMVVNGTPPCLYKWGKGIADTLSHVNLKVIKDTILELEVTDANGLTAYSWVNVKLKTPLVDAGSNKNICKGDSTLLIAVTTKFSGPVAWSWFLNGNKIGNQNSLMALDIGYYLAIATDSTGCFSKDSVLLKNFPDPVIKLYDSSYCQDKNTLNQFELIKKPKTINHYKNVQWQLLKSLKNLKGLDNTLTDLLTDLDTTAKYNFSVAFDKSIIDLGTKNKDSLIFSIQVTDSNKCKSSDTGIIVIKKSPTLNFKYQKKMFCRSETIHLDSLVNHDGDSRVWTKVNESGYSNYPATGEVKDGIINPYDFNIQGGIYKINVLSKIGDCETKGSMDLDVIPIPVPIIEKKEFKDSVSFTDKSLYSSSHFWYLDTVFVSNDTSITLAKKAADGKSITLELANGKCNVDTIFTYKMVGVKILKNDFIKIYPNPANTDLTIQQVLQFKNSTYQIYNSLGELILKGELKSKETVVDIDNFATGLYFLRVNNEKMTVSFQFVKAE